MDDTPSASSNKSEPIITVGPGGKTIVSHKETTKIGPGMELTVFERFDPRGWLNGEVLTIDLGNHAVTTDLLFPGVITDAKPVSELTKLNGAVAGVNGDFFDINNTKAPSGVMIQNGNLLKGPQGAHTLAAGVDEHGLGKITNIFLEGTVHLPSGSVELAALNQSSIPVDGIGLYTSVWGKRSARIPVQPMRLPFAMVLSNLPPNKLVAGRYQKIVLSLLAGKLEPNN